MGVAEAVEQIAFPVKDADAVADVGDAALNGRGSLFADEDGGVGAFADDVDGAGLVSWPLADEFALSSEDLDAVTSRSQDNYEVVARIAMWGRLICRCRCGLATTRWCCRASIRWTRELP